MPKTRELSENEKLSILLRYQKVLDGRAEETITDLANHLVVPWQDIWDVERLLWLKLGNPWALRGPHQNRSPC